MMMWTEKGFGLNDYFVIAAVILLWGIYFLIPKIFSKQIIVLLFLFSLTAASISDNSFGAAPFDYYDIMDGPAYTGMDVVVYLLYPPFGYFFMFFYKKYRIRNRYLVLYIFLFTLFSIGFEWLQVKMGVFQYKHGYTIVYSICIYLVFQSLFVSFFRLIKVSR